MRIIDKNKDFYDYFQGIYPDDTFTFDRRGSLPLEDLRKHCESKIGYEFFLHLIFGFTHYMIKVTTTKIVRDEYNIARTTECSFEFVKTWKDYSYKELIKVQIVKPRNWQLKPIKDIKEYLNKNESRIKDLEYLPILKDSGLVKFLPPQEIYFAIEEYFSDQKQKLETRDSKSLTNKEKIVNHGFDTEYSFRNKK